VTNTLMGLGAYPGSDRQFVGMLGMHGFYEANMAMHHSDVILAVGARFDDRVTNTVSKFCPGAKIIHVSISIRPRLPRSCQSISRLSGRSPPFSRNWISRSRLQMESAERALPDADSLGKWWQQIDSWREAHGLWHGRRYGESAFHHASGRDLRTL